MIDKLKNIKKVGLLAASLPFIVGCGGGGGGAAFLGSLFGSSGTLFASGGGGVPQLLSVGGSDVVMTNPEPATMILMGSGMAAMAYFKSKKIG